MPVRERNRLMKKPMTRADLPPDLPPEALVAMEETRFLEPDELCVGAPAPDVPLYTADVGEVRLSQFRGVRPVVLVFGSYT